MKKIFEALLFALPLASLVTAAWCFFRMMFYNVSSVTEIAFYVSIGIMLVFLVGLFVVASDDDAEY